MDFSDVPIISVCGWKIPYCTKIASQNTNVGNKTQDIRRLNIFRQPLFFFRGNDIHRKSPINSVTIIIQHIDFQTNSRPFTLKNHANADFLNFEMLSLFNID